MKNSSAPGPVFVSRKNSFDATDNWEHYNVSQSYSTENDKPYVAIDNTGGSRDGNIYVSWTKARPLPQKILFAYSTNHGLSYQYSEVEPLATLPQYYDSVDAGLYTSPPGGDGIPGHFSMPVVGPNGDVYVVWTELNGKDYNASYIKMRKSTNGGQTFGSTVTVTAFTHSRSQVGYIQITNIPSVAVDPTNGSIDIAYMDDLSQANASKRIKLVRSTNGGTNWSVVNTDIAGIGVGNQFFPWLSVEPTGRVVIHFLHSTNSTQAHTYITESNNGGASFISPYVIESNIAASNAINGYDYQGVATSGNGMYYMLYTTHTTATPYNSNPTLAAVNFLPTPTDQVAYTVVNSHPRIQWGVSTPFFANQPITKYEIFRSSNINSIGTKIAETNGSTQTYTDNQIWIGSGGNFLASYYRVRAQDTYLRFSQNSSQLLINHGNSGEGYKPDVVQLKPTEYKLHQNFPNPFNPSTNITFELPEDNDVSIKIYDLLGRVVGGVAENFYTAGVHTVTVNASNLSTGVYVYSIETPHYRTKKKMILTK